MPKGVRIGGRQKGTPNKVNAELKDMILGALTKAGGQRYLEEQARESPQAFMALLGKVLPKDLHVTPKGGFHLSIGLSTQQPAAKGE